MDTRLTTLWVPPNWGERSEPLLVRSMPNFLVIDRSTVRFVPRGPGAGSNARNYCVYVRSVYGRMRTNARSIWMKQNSGFEEGENLTDSIGLEKQLNNVRYDWQGGENSIERVILSHCSWIWKTCYTLCAQNS